MSEKGAFSYDQPPPPGYVQPPPPGYGQPPPPGYGQPTTSSSSSYPVSTSTTVVMSQPELYGSISMFREHPVRTKCPACNAEVLTSTSFESGTLTWVACLVLAFIGLWLGCCLIPFCLDGCKDVVHSCPNCRHTIGRFNRM
ncbi:hypothetical protein FSP39_018456 [Pinctada imbricata]|uniref:LITAF domain-containing protein n=1 Tax=Pinctada imbricata TaxID=66713 RepID=A0AA89C7Q5_PINIB|nr:hypothetical protein FSP39_018456 [Pinctada imbricata]